VAIEKGKGSFKLFIRVPRFFLVLTPVNILEASLNFVAREGY
jgi:hypothetical protein